MEPMIIVSNRLPVSVSRGENGGFVYNHANGGLATAMSSLNLKNGYTWIGWPGIAADDLTDREKAEINQYLAEQYHCVPVFLTGCDIENFYEGYSNDTLWPLCHYFSQYAVHKNVYWESYQHVNQLYKDAVLQNASDTSMIWLHDYHLMLLPNLVRKALPSAKIGFFLHIPFPSYEIFRQLPERNELIKGLLGADLVGFHVYDYARHFISSAVRLAGAESLGGTLEYHGRTIKVDTYPIGIDYDRFTQELATKNAQEELAELKERLAGQKLIVAVDRLDYSKGIMERLRGYELFLDQHPEYREKVVLHMIEAPSRTEVPAYQALREEVEQMVSRINGAYSTYHWAPIVYYFQNFGFDKIVPLYAAADIALITPLRDGMNLVAKEYIACKQNSAGVLILSETAGAADELLNAIQINPNDSQQISDSIHEALTMPAREQKARLRRMQKRLKNYSVQHWGQEFVDDLATATSAHNGSDKKQISGNTTKTILGEFTSASSRLLLLDYDGTLQPLAANPATTTERPSGQLVKLVTELAALPDTKVVIMSGRKRDPLERWFGKISRLSLVAEHGAYIKDHGQWEKRAEPFNSKPLLRIMKRYDLRTAGAMVEEKQFGLVWHYRHVNPELAYVRSAELRRELLEAAEGMDIGVYNGRKILEVKPNNLHKGTIAREFADHYPSDFILAAGDSSDDEDVFKALPAHAHTIRIGAGRTHAKHRAGSYEYLIALLQDIVKVKGE